MIELDRSWKALTEPGNATEYAFDRAMGHDPPGPTFSRSLAILAAEASRLAYNPNRAIRERALARGGLQELALLEHQSSAALVLVSPSANILLVAYRGTDEPEDWRLNLNVKLVDWGAGRAHRGFVTAFRNLESEVAARLAGRSERLVLTGHSQGGAVAALGGTRLAAAAVYTFGAPRVATTESFTASHAVPQFRIVNGFDPVPELPPGGPPFHFAHHGDCVVLSELGITTGPPPTFGERIEGLARALTNRTAWATTGSRPPDWLSDHAPVNYVARLVR